MPLTPAAARYLEQVGEAAPVETFTVAELRAAMRERLDPSVPLAPVRAVEDLDADGVPVRVYHPKTGPDGRGPHPAVVYLHGGGWILGDLDSGQVLCRRMASGVPCTVVSVGYRLAPEHPYPAAVDDVYAALVWVADNAGRLGIDATRIAVAGDSAGGNLAAVTALQARDRGGPALAFQLLVYPITDDDVDNGSYLECADGYGLRRADMMWFWDLYLTDPAQAADPRVSPLKAPDLSGLPPALVITAEYDPLRDEGEAYGRRLAEAGRARVSRYEGAIHGFFGSPSVFPEAEEAIAEAVEALRDAFARM